MNKTNPLHIRIPRTKFGKTDERWPLVRKHGGSRRKMVDFITSIGGYHGGRSDGPFAIEFNVAAYKADLSVENLWKLLTSGDMDLGPDKDLPPEHMAQAKALFWRVYAEYENHVWQWGVEEAYEGWSDSDTPYETFTGERVDWRFGLFGRGGKHLCMTEWEGNNLTIKDDDLEDLLMQKGDGIDYDISADDLRKLFIICVQNTVELTPTKVGEEVEYRAAWRLWSSFCEDQLADAISIYEGRQQLGKDAGMIADRLVGEPALHDSFVAICDIADIKITDWRLT